MKTFASQDEAIEWMEQTVDDPYMDNYRFAYINDKWAMKKYNIQVNKGCCGFFDEEVIVSGKKAKIGCNFGH